MDQSTVKSTLFNKRYCQDLQGMVHAVRMTVVAYSMSYVCMLHSLFSMT